MFGSVFTWFASGSVAASRAAAHGAPSTDPTGTFGMSTGTRPRSEPLRSGVCPAVRTASSSPLDPPGPSRNRVRLGPGRSFPAPFRARRESAAETRRHRHGARRTQRCGAGRRRAVWQASCLPAPPSSRGEVKPRRRREPVGPALRTLPAVSQATVPLETAAKPRTADYAYYVSRGVLRGLLPDQPDSGMRRAASYAVRIRTRTCP